MSYYSLVKKMLKNTPLLAVTNKHITNVCILYSAYF